MQNLVHSVIPHSPVYSPEIGMKEINFNLVYAQYWTDEDYYVQLEKKSIKCAEVLVPYMIPHKYIMCAAVIDKDAVHKLEDVGFDKTIEIVPWIFF